MPPGESLKTLRTVKPASFATAVTATLFAATIAASPAGAEEPPAIEVPLVNQAPEAWGHTFDGIDSIEDLPGWAVPDRRDYRNKQVFLTGDAVTFEDGKLIITTARHCVDNEGDALTDENISEDPCPEGKKTFYTTARVYTPWFEGGEFSTEVTGEIRTPDVRGARSAIWLQNDNEYCTGSGFNRYYGEIDMVEHYTHGGNLPMSPSTVHLGCNQETRKTVGHSQRRTWVYPALTDAEHTWRADIGKRTIAFSLDGAPINQNWRHETLPDISHDEWEDMDQELWDRIMHRPWRLILNQYVESAAWAQPAGDEDPFPVRRLIIDSVQVTYPQNTDDTEQPAVPAPTDSSTSADRSGSSVVAQLLGVIGVLGLLAIPLIGWLTQNLQLPALPGLPDLPTFPGI
nr:family 16 glycosylhydrolase [Corynebacterium pygosceleis]